MKKIFSGLLLLLLLLSGCSDDTEEVTITLLQNKVEISSALENLATTYMDENPGVKIEIQTSGDDYPTTLQSAFASGNGPSIFTTYPGIHFDSYQEYMEPLSDIELLSYVDESSVELSMVDGETYGVPVAIEGVGLIYNMEILNEVGVELDDINTTEGFVELCNKIYASGYNCVEIAPEGGFIGEHLSNVPYAMQEKPYDFVDGLISGSEKLVSNTEFESWVEVINTIQETSNTDVLGSSYDEQINNFANGNSAFMHNGNWVEPVFSDYDINFEYGFKGLPVANNTELSIFVPTYWSVNNAGTEEEVSVAKDFINWLYTDETSQESIINDMGIVPPYKNFTDVSGLSPLSTDIYNQYQSGDYLVWALYYAGQENLDNISTQNQKWFSGEQTGQDTLENTQNEFSSGE